MHISCGGRILVHVYSTGPCLAASDCSSPDFAFAFCLRKLGGGAGAGAALLSTQYTAWENVNAHAQGVSITLICWPVGQSDGGPKAASFHIMKR